MTLYRRVWTMELREGAEAEYDAAHANIWPDLTAQMTQNGIVRFFLYRAGTTVFAFQERNRPFPASNHSPPSGLTARWWRKMAPLMCTEGPEARPVHHDLREVFALDVTTETTT
ncbi:L-rhamnose mutarotase [Amaricoccus tamworthensis]|uniref:L-rhamnose mutarotase n=1 Tax=Amaricoccus tamworthensis TaxID=57002 RepID=UPI003C7B8E6F